MRILGEVARIRDPRAVQFLVEVARDQRYNPLLGSLIKLMATIDDSADVAAFFREQMSPSNPHRLVARNYLYARALRHRDDEWLARLFDRGSVEDRFLALEGMGRIGSRATLRSARALVRSSQWQPVSGTVVSCGTIAAALKEQEGPAAARLLLVLQRDPRFDARDAEALREATRLWRNRDLKSYIRIEALADPDVMDREDSARFMGEAGIETARAPLVSLAHDPYEPASVRAAAAAALGGLAIAKGDLAHTLSALLRDPDLDEQVRKGAIEGLGRLKVRQAAAALVEATNGPLGADARAALAELAEMPADTDWAEWLKTCRLPAGT